MSMLVYAVATRRRPASENQRNCRRAASNSCGRTSRCYRWPRESCSTANGRETRSLRPDSHETLGDQQRASAGALRHSRPRPLRARAPGESSAGRPAQSARDRSKSRADDRSSFWIHRRVGIASRRCVRNRALSISVRRERRRTCLSSPLFVRQFADGSERSGWSAAAAYQRSTISSREARSIDTVRRWSVPPSAPAFGCACWARGRRMRLRMFRELPLVKIGQANRQT